MTGPFWLACPFKYCADNDKPISFLCAQQLETVFENKNCLPKKGIATCDFCRRLCRPSIAATLMALATSVSTQSSKRCREEPNACQPDYYWHSQSSGILAYYTTGQARPVGESLAHIARLSLRLHRFRKAMTSMVDRRSLASDTT